MPGDVLEDDDDNDDDEDGDLVDARSSVVLAVPARTIVIAGMSLRELRKEQTGVDKVLLSNINKQARTAARAELTRELRFVRCVAQCVASGDDAALAAHWIRRETVSIDVVVAE
jgi:hypothetical protein